MQGCGGVVGGEEVLDYGAGFPESEVCVWVCDRRDAAIGVEGFERFWKVRLVYYFGLEMMLLEMRFGGVPFFRSAKSMISVS